LERLFLFINIMYPVYLNSSDEQYSFETFSKHFIEICNQHQKDEKALVFAFILYDLQDAHITKILNDKAYWTSLHNTSGHYLTVFTLNCLETEDKSSMTEYITAINDYRNPSESADKLLKEYFGDKVKVKYPSVLFFQVNEHEIMDFTLVELDEQKIEESFIELKNYIKKVVQELKFIKPENRGNLKEIFNNTESILKSEKWRRINIKRFKALVPFIRFGTSIAKLGS
jgi:hypothetical protein